MKLPITLTAAALTAALGAATIAPAKADGAASTRNGQQVACNGQYCSITTNGYGTAYGPNGYGQGPSYGSNGYGTGYQAYARHRRNG
ncbi:MAG: hypothetical protein M3R44_01040 [Candidatus Eremiobacteraeota bacterium]|nr:hypothetical protein [Candidatus Eremiobacteraeota bacterium]